MRTVLCNLITAVALLFLMPVDGVAGPLLFGGIGFGSQLNRGAVVTVDDVTAAGVLVGVGVGPSAGLNGLTFDPVGSLYGTTTNDPILDPAVGVPTLVRLDPATGTSLFSALLTVQGNALEVNDLAAHPVTSVLYGVSLSTVDFVSSLYTIDKVSGAATLIGPTGVIGVTLAFAPNGTLYMTSAEFNMMGVQVGSFLNTVDPATAMLLSTTPIAPLSSGNLVHIGGLAVSPLDGTIFASGRESNVAQRGDIYTLSTGGSAQLVGSTGVGEVGDLAFTPIPEPTTVLLLGTGIAALGASRSRRKRKSE